MIKEWIKDRIRNTKNGVTNIYKWFPVIWKDRQWDHQYIYEVFRHKLHLTEQFIRHHGHHTNHIRDADRIKLCVTLFDRLMKDEYHESAFKSHHKKWGEPDFDWIDAKGYPEMKELLIKYPNVKTEKDKENERKQFRRSSQDEVNLRKQDLDLLFKIMRKHIQGWWD